MKPTKIYRPKSLVSPFKMGKKEDGMYVAIPNNYKENTILIKYKDETMVVKDWNAAEEFREFEDKFGRGTYALAYFKWEPQTSQRQLF